MMPVVPSRTQVRLDLIEEIKSLKERVENMRHHFSIFYEMNESETRNMQAKLDLLLIEAKKI